MTQSLVWLIPGLPLLACALLAVGGERLSRTAVTVTAVAAAVGSALVAALIIGVYLVLPPGGGAILQNLGQWIDAGGLSARIALRLDPLSLVMVAVVLAIALLVQSWPGPAAANDHRSHRAGLSLFAGGLLVLLLAENLLLAYLGWQLAGLAGLLLSCRDATRSILLAECLAAVAVLVALLLLFTELGTLHLPTLLARAGAAWSAADPRAMAAAALLAGGLVVRVLGAPLRAQLSPPPVAALVQGAALGAASVYLIARLQVLFALAPVVQVALVALGAFLLLAATGRASFERDLMRLLGQAALGQIGVMLLALGLGAPSAAVFHFLAHAGAIALLFLAAGVLIAAADGERDLFRLAGVARHRPAAALAFAIGAASLGALPLLTAGFYSQAAILHAGIAASFGGPWSWLVLLVGVFLTALSLFRVLFVLLRGEQVSAPFGSGLSRTEGGVLIALAVLALTAGFVAMPAALGGFRPLPELLHYVLPAADTSGAGAPLAGAGPMLAQAAVALAGPGLAWWLYRREVSRTRSDGRAVEWARRWHDFAAHARRRTARPWAAARDRQHDLADGLHRWLAAVAIWGHGHLADSQSGRLRAYAIGMVGGVIILISIVVLP